jgi:hypothetical protein
MPPKPAAVLNQRRMSYDTATGSYLLVTKMEQEQAVQERLLAQGQQQVQLLLPQQQVQAVDVAVASSMQQVEPLQQQLQQPEVQQQLSLQDGEVRAMQGAAGSSSSPGPSSAAQQYQAHVQRLVAALAKKGYSTSLLDGNASGPCNASTAEQQQQAGAGVDFLGSTSAAAVPALQQQLSTRSRGSAPGAAMQMPRQRYIAKVCDFGFSQCLRAGQSHCSTAAAGTITHQAPEVLRSGHLSPAADIYAFGIIRKYSFRIARVLHALHELLLPNLAIISSSVLVTVPTALCRIR